MRVLVTGGAGFIGSHIVERLGGEGHSVCVVDNLSTGRAANLPPEIELIEMDVASPGFRAVARLLRPEAIVHCAAQPSVVVSMADPWLDAWSNVVGVIGACSAAVAAGCRQFVYLSTGGALYGVAERLPFREDDPVCPISCYGVSKWMGEHYVKLLLPASIPARVLRLANVFGPRQDPAGEAGVIAIFAGRMLRREPVVIFGDGEQTRDFVYVGDIADAVARALRAPGALTANIGSG